jgi:hypothetical protein
MVNGKFHGVSFNDFPWTQHQYQQEQHFDLVSPNQNKGTHTRFAPSKRKKSKPRVDAEKKAQK